jgi:hypothetical protein
LERAIVQPAKRYKENERAFDEEMFLRHGRDRSLRRNGKISSILTTKNCKLGIGKRKSKLRPIVSHI